MWSTQNQRILLTSSMIPDGLTKVLPKEDFMRFRDQMGLVEIAERIKEQEKVNH
jgi:hypothetical protein